MDGNQETFVNPKADTILKYGLMKQSAFKHRRRRHFDWTDNYTLYRDKVMLNRLTQRQSVNIPLIKSSIKTLLKDIDDAPNLYFSSLDNNEQAEIFYNLYWKDSTVKNHLDLKDIQDKRQVLLFGRSFKMLNIEDGAFTWEIIDPQDMLIDRYVDPTNIDSARYIIQEHIYVPLSSLTANPMYDSAAVKRLQEFFSTENGLIKADENQLDWVEKQRREASLGVVDAFSPMLGETYVELNKFFVKEFNEQTNQNEIQFAVMAEDEEVLYACPLEDHIGETKDHFWQSHYPLSTWGDETERTDFWSDGVADTLRTLNKVLNSWFSQLIENRTLRNYNMNYFNSSLTDEGFTPQTFEAEPWGWYPIPVTSGGKIQDNIMQVDVPDISTTLAEIEFIMNIAQQASAATTMQEGVKQPGEQVTLGEVKMLLNNATERIKSMAVYYTASWKDFGLKYTKLLEAADDLLDPVTVTKKGRLTKKLYSKKVSPKDWVSENGYLVEVQMKEDMDAKNGEDLQKLQYPKSLMPTNKVLDTIVKRKSLEFADVSPAEIAEVIKEDEVQQQQMAQAQASGLVPAEGGTPAVGAPPPMQPAPLPPTA